MVVLAAARAQKSADFIQGLKAGAEEPAPATQEAA